MRKIFLIFMLLNMIILLNGCWDIREINELGLVTAVAIDKGEGQNKYSITVQIANVSNQNTSEGNSAAEKTVWVGTSEGESLFDATRNLVGISSRRIMWAHNNVIIIGEALAKEGIIPVVDFFTHNPELRMKAIVVVARGDGKKYIVAKAGMENPSVGSFILVAGYRALEAESVESNMLKVSSDLRNEYANPLITAISLKKATIQSIEGDNKGKNSETVDLEGAAVFKKGKMIGWLSPKETLGVSWIHNETKDTVVTVIDPDHGNKSVSVETKAVKAKIRTEVVDGMPKLSIYITGKGDIVEEDGSTSQNLGEVKEHIAALVNQKIEDEIKQSLETIQKKYMVDVLGFAAFVHAQNGSEWKSGIKDNWQKIFPKIPVTVSVDIKIKSSTLNQEPMKVY